jgi:hypothetical protein
MAGLADMALGEVHLQAHESFTLALPNRCMDRCSSYLAPGHVLVYLLRLQERGAAAVRENLVLNKSKKGNL